MDTMPQTNRSPSGVQWRIRAADQEAVVVEVGGGLREYRVAGESIVDGYGADELCPASAGQVLAPWPNRVRDGRYTFAGATYQLALTEPARHNAAHGLVSWVRWTCVESTGSSATVECDLPAQPGYPWPLLLRTVWTVGEHGLVAAHSVTNLSADPAPFGLGAHPYLRLAGAGVDDLVLHLPARSRLLSDSRLLPIGAAKVAGTEYDFTQPRRLGATVLDDAFGEVERGPDGHCAVRLGTADGGRAVEVWADSAFRWWQVFTADTLPGARRRRSVAIEPMTCPPDALRSGRDVVVLAPGDTWHGSWGIRPTRKVGHGDGVS
ncbi:MAG TPA: aldose 1-epimerase family protein [Micromonosporaceae bacterium]|nr:aldose 1-epimerase family protein [Micromonosporaceae bacterium]